MRVGECIVKTSNRVEARDLIGWELRRVSEEVLESNGLVVSAIVEKLMEQLERREQVVLLQQKIHNAIAQRRPLHVHRSLTVSTALTQRHGRTTEPKQISGTHSLWYYFNFSGAPPPPDRVVELRGRIEGRWEIRCYASVLRSMLSRHFNRGSYAIQLLAVHLVIHIYSVSYVQHV